MKNVLDVITMPPLTVEDRARLGQFHDDLAVFGTAALLVGADGSFTNIGPTALFSQADRPSEGPAGGQPPAGGETGREAK